MRIDEISGGSLPYGYWVNHDGEAIPVWNHQEHYKVANEWFWKRYPEFEGEPGAMIARALGWVRLSIEWMKNGVYRLNIEPTNNMTAKATEGTVDLIRKLDQMASIYEFTIDIPGTMLGWVAFNLDNTKKPADEVIKELRINSAMLEEPKWAAAEVWKKK